MNMNDFEEVNCPVCGSGDYETLAKKGKFDLPLNYSLCTNCGLGYLNPRWTKDRYQHFYQHEYDKYYRSDVLTKETDAVRYRTVKQVVARMQQLHPLTAAPKRILDIGSGMGWSLAYLQKELYPTAELYAIEPSDHCAENLKVLGVEVVSRDVDSNWDEPHQGKFDLIIMRHVLEHFMNPVAVLKKVAATLSENGVLYVAVPNAENPGFPLSKSYLRVVHTYYFTPHSLNNVFLMAGLTTKQIHAMDTVNPYELYSFAQRSGTMEAPVIDAREFDAHKQRITRLQKKEKDVLFKAGRFVKSRMRKYFG